MFAYKLLLSTFYTLYIDTSVVSWFHLHFLLRQIKNGISNNLQLHLVAFHANMDSNPRDVWRNGYWMDLTFFFFFFFCPGLLSTCYYFPNFPFLKKWVGIDLGFTKKILFLNSHISGTQGPGEVLPPLVFISPCSACAWCQQEAFVTWRKKKLPKNVQSLHSTARDEPKILTQSWMSGKSQCLYVGGVFSN